MRSTENAPHLKIAEITKAAKGDFISSISEKILSTKKTFRASPTISLSSSPKHDMNVYIAMLHWLLAGHFMFECTEVLLEAGMAKQKMKMHMKALFPELERLVNEDWGLLIGPDALAETTFNLQDHFTQFIQEWNPRQFIKHRPELLAGFTELLNEFHNAPELVLHRNGIKIKEAK